MNTLSTFSRYLYLALLLISMLLTSNAVGVVDIYTFDSESQRERYFQLSEELRCPKCQNQNLAGSDSQIAGDLRRELRRLLEEGKTDPEIKQFMVDRYGEFVLYKPRLQKSTMILWGLPLLLLLVGVIIVLFIVRRKKAQVGGEVLNHSSGLSNEVNTEAELNEQEREQLSQLLTQSSNIEAMTSKAEAPKAAPASPSKQEQS
ncbi:cytochrome c-type biogenesis protein [Eionea flava]